MKNKIFDKGLYIEGLRRTGTVTAVFSAAGLLSVFFTAVLNGNGNVGLPENGGAVIYWFLYVAMYLCTPVITLVTFSFLNKRGASDFWHSIPQSRTCLYVSFASSALTATAAVYAATVLMSAAAQLLSGKTAGMPGMLSLAAVCFCGSMLICAVFTAASSFTGTLLSCSAASLMMLFVPRTVLNCVLWIIREAIGSTAVGKVGFPLSDAGYNYPAGLILNAVWFERSEVGTWASAIYTAVLALIYFTAGLFLFRARKSETAGAAAPSKFMQAFMRIALGCSVSFVATLYLVKTVMTGNGSAAASVVIYVVAAAVYFLYELVTTKRASTLGRAAPGLLIVVALNLILGFGAAAAYGYEAGFGTDPEKVASVSVRIPYTWYDTVAMDDVAMEKMSEYEITDRSIIGQIGKAIEEQRGNSSTPSGASVVTVKTKTDKRQRLLALSPSLVSEIRKYVKNTDEYTVALSAYPPIDPSTDALYFRVCNTDKPGGTERVRKGDLSLRLQIGNEKLVEIYDIYKAETALLGKDVYADLMADRNCGRRGGVFTLEIEPSGAGRKVKLVLPVSADITPKTYKELCAGLSGDSGITPAGLIDSLRKAGRSDERIDTLSVYLLDDGITGLFSAPYNTGRAYAASVADAVAQACPGLKLCDDGSPAVLVVMISDNKKTYAIFKTNETDAGKLTPLFTLK